MSGWSTEKLQVETRIKRRGRKALFKEPGLDAHMIGANLYGGWLNVSLNVKQPIPIIFFHHLVPRGYNPLEHRSLFFEDWFYDTDATFINFDIVWWIAGSSSFSL